MYYLHRPNTLPAFSLPIIGALLALLVTLLAGAQQPPTEKKEGEVGEIGMNDAERAFSEQLSNVVLTGRFTTDGKDGDPAPEKYQIVSVTKVRNHNWVILARISYGDRSDQVPAIPIPVKVYWADDTPVLSLTDLTIPGFGTFTSRVMFFGNRYAGTWQHGDKGGQLFGTITKVKESAETPSSRE